MASYPLRWEGHWLSPMVELQLTARRLQLTVTQRLLGLLLQGSLLLGSVPLGSELLGWRRQQGPRGSLLALHRWEWLASPSRHLATRWSQRLWRGSLS
jgi:hypothetical protein